MSDDLVERLRAGDLCDLELAGIAAALIEEQAAEIRRLREALRPFVETVIILPTGDIVGLERHHFENARAAMETDKDTTP
jgi:hypothetical protein